MTGRDPHERGRTATTLELLFDLTFVIAFSAAAGGLAHELAEGHYRAGILGFAFCSFAIVWAWVNYAWFASAFDTDDWAVRILVFVQMLGVLIVAIGIPDAYDSLSKNEDFDNKVIVAGYVVMRVAMIFQWLRAAKQDPAHRAEALSYVTTITLAQIGWVVLIFVNFSLWQTALLMGALFLVELGGPVLAERQGGTPWHPHHIAERYGLLFIVTIGEALVGVVSALSAFVQAEGWSVEAITVGFSGTLLVFLIWWTYFLNPGGELLAARPSRSFIFGYVHIILFGAVAAIGAGLDVSALFVEHHAHIGETAVVATIAIPVIIFVLTSSVIYGSLLRPDTTVLVLTAIQVLIAASAVALSALGVPLLVCLVVVALTPVVTVLADELFLHRRADDQLGDLSDAD